jgi:hypothetical protein
VTPIRVALYAVCAAIAVVAGNFIYQVVRKPTELFFPVSGEFYKTPEESWRAYAHLFRRYATAHVSAELLAALAQVEARGTLQFLPPCLERRGHVPDDRSDLRGSAPLVHP